MGNEKRSKIKTIKLNSKTKKKANKALQEGVVIVAYLAPWCGHCREFKPTWNELMKKYKKLTSTQPCSLMEIKDKNERFLMAKENQPNGFPTIRVFRKGEKMSDYEGARDMESMTNFINSKFGLVMTGGRIKKRKKTRKRKRKRRRKTRKKLFFGLF